jgi:hypothetical protein
MVIDFLSITNSPTHANDKRFGKLVGKTGTYSSTVGEEKNDKKTVESSSPLGCPAVGVQLGLAAVSLLHSLS